MSNGAMPVLADDSFVARDGARLPLRRWEAQGNPRAVIVALHGMSDYSNAFDMPGRYWAKLGITTLAYRPARIWQKRQSRHLGGRRCHARRS